LNPKLVIVHGRPQIFISMAFLLQLWVSLHFMTTLAVIVAIILSFRDPSYVFLPLLPSTASQIVRIIAQVQGPNPLPLTFASLKMNFSVHVIAMNLLFWLSGVCSVNWLLVLGIDSFRKVLWYLATVVVPAMNQSSITSAIVRFYQYFDQGQIADTAMAFLEIMNLLPGGVRGFIRSMVRFCGYLFGYALYRYATDPVHRRTWAQFRAGFTQLVTKLP
jgi:hypothetical protein